MKYKDWFKARGYRHIDTKITLSDRRKIVHNISNPKFVANHGFLPLIYKTISERKYKKFKDENGLYYRSHTDKDTGQSTKKVRPIHDASHLDSQIYSFYNHKILSPAYEKILNKTSGLSNSISAYRRIPSQDGFRHKSNIHFAKDVFDEVKRRGECVALAIDVKNFFSSLDHKLLLERWKEILGVNFLPPDHYNLYKSITQFHYIRLDDLRTKNRGFDEREISTYQKFGVDAFFKSMVDFRERVKAKEFLVRKNQFHKTEGGKRRLIGIPQGLPISALLANIYMYRFDLETYTELSQEKDVFYRRYSDDIVLICSNEQRNYVESFIREKISGEAAKLKLSENKTERIIFRMVDIGGKKRLQSFLLNINGDETFNIPMNYLGFQFFGYQTLVKNNRLSGFYRRMKRAVRLQHIKAEKAKERNLLKDKVIYKRRIYRLFSYKGIKKRELASKRRFILIRNNLGYWIREPHERHNKHRGNALKYAYKASEIMKAPEIKRQYRNHFYILQKTIKKYNFDNCKKD